MVEFIDYEPPKEVVVLPKKVVATKPKRAARLVGSFKPLGGMKGEGWSVSAASGQARRQGKGMTN